MNGFLENCLVFCWDVFLLDLSCIRVALEGFFVKFIPLSDSGVLLVRIVVIFSIMLKSDFHVL